MQTFWLIRHAHRLDFIEPAWFETAMYPYDPPLSSQGLDRAIELVRQFDSIPIDLILASPFLRTIQTAAPLATSLQLPIRLEWGLCEWLCRDWTPELPKTTPIDELMRCYPNIDVNYQSLVMPCYPETLEELDVRLYNISQQLIDRNCDHLLTIAHKGSILGIVAALTGDRQWQKYDLPCGGIIKLTRSGDRWQATII
jgi:broad specificity phosphatase PhoE